MQPDIYDASAHHLTEEHIDPDALYITHKLQSLGHRAYIVGGGVRDLLRGLTPKDFDIATSAKPEEIKKIFRSSLLIGRRFPLAHVRFGKKFIEVATFRSGAVEDDSLIVKDNAWGTEEEDVFRRDFTINGLYLNPSNMQVIDYVKGWEDLQKGLLRTIGDPVLRFKQDPARMLRLLKFVARYGYNVDEKSLDAMKAVKEEILKSSPARILDQLFIMLESGSAAKFWELLHQYGLHELLLPELARNYKEEHFELLKHADRLIQQGTNLSRSTLCSALLWPHYLQEVQSLEKTPDLGTLSQMADEFIVRFFVSSFRLFPRKIRYETAFALFNQFRFAPLQPKKSKRFHFAKHRDFPLAMEFLSLRKEIEPSLQSEIEEWQNPAPVKPRKIKEPPLRKKTTPLPMPTEEPDGELGPLGEKELHEYYKGFQ